ncbi:MAG: GNAT family N-acetyltransferase [Actinomycetota bacterium]|nr:GNAT family N-acetyltransferase [Actinomycetota bacterium]
MSDTAELWARMQRSMREEFRLMPEATGGTLLERDGVIATIVPAVPERSLPNSVLYEDEDALASLLEELAEAYHQAGVRAWTVWVPRRHERTRALLERSGHVLDGDPAAMVADLATVEAPREDDPVPDAEPRLEDLGRLNDLAYGTGDQLARVIGKGEADPAHVYLASEGGRTVAGLITADHDGDCSVWWVATAPEARGRGLASGLMRHALAGGRERGCDISTLQASKLGRPVYEALGYRAFGVFEMWERRCRA